MYGSSFCGRQHAFVGIQSINGYPNYVSLSACLASHLKNIHISMFVLLLQNIALLDWRAVFA